MKIKQLQWKKSTFVKNMEWVEIGDLYASIVKRENKFLLQFQWQTRMVHSECDTMDEAKNQAQRLLEDQVFKYVEK